MKTINGVKCRTAVESLNRIIRAAKSGKIGPTKEDEIGRCNDSACLYEYPSGNNCAVGCLFSKQQLKHIKTLGNDMSIKDISHYVGKENIEIVTGLSLKDLDALQEVHDDAVNYDIDGVKEEIIEAAKKMLKKYKGKQ